jgi:sugar phosphate permease
MWPLRFYALFGIIVTIMFWLLTSERKQIETPQTNPSSVTARAGDNLFRNPVLILVSLALFLAFFQLYGVYTWVPPYLAEVLRLSPAEIGIGTMALTFSAVPAALFTGWLADRTGKGIIVVIGGSLIAATSIVLVALVGAPFWAVAAVCFITGWGISMVAIPLFTISGATVAPALAGRATGFASTWAYAGGILSSYWGGYVVTTVGRYDAAFVTFAASVLVAGIVVCPFVKRALSHSLASGSTLVSGDRV